MWRGRSLVWAIYIFPVRPSILRILLFFNLTTHSLSRSNQPTNPSPEGDGEISFCGAIEMAGVITLKFSVMKNGLAELGIKSPIYIPGPVEPQFGAGRYIYFEGFSVDEHGKQHYMDATVAYRQTSLRVIEYLRRYGMLCAINTLHYQSPSEMWGRWEGLGEIFANDVVF